MHLFISFFVTDFVRKIRQLDLFSHQMAKWSIQDEPQLYDERLQEMHSRNTRRFVGGIRTHAKKILVYRRNTHVQHRFHLAEESSLSVATVRYRFYTGKLCRKEGVISSYTITLPWLQINVIAFFLFPVVKLFTLLKCIPLLYVHNSNI